MLRSQLLTLLGQRAFCDRAGAPMASAWPHLHRLRGGFYRGVFSSGPFGMERRNLSTAGAPLAHAQAPLSPDLRSSRPGQDRDSIATLPALLPTQPGPQQLRPEADGAGQAPAAAEAPAAAAIEEVAGPSGRYLDRLMRGFYQQPLLGFRHRRHLIRCRSAPVPFPAICPTPPHRMLLRLHPACFSSPFPRRIWIGAKGPTRPSIPTLPCSTPEVVDSYILDWMHRVEADAGVVSPARRPLSPTGAPEQDGSWLQRLLGPGRQRRQGLIMAPQDLVDAELAAAQDLYLDLRRAMRGRGQGTGLVQERLVWPGARSFLSIDTVGSTPVRTGPSWIEGLSPFGRRRLQPGPTRRSSHWALGTCAWSTSMARWLAWSPGRTWTGRATDSTAAMVAADRRRRDCLATQGFPFAPQTRSLMGPQHGPN